MPNSNFDEALQVLQLAAGVEPVVLGFIKNILNNAQGKTGDEFLSEADGLWDDVVNRAKLELANASTKP